MNISSNLLNVNILTDVFKNAILEEMLFQLNHVNDPAVPLSRFFWQMWEDGKIKALITGLDRKTLIRGLQTKESLSSGAVHEKILDLVANWKDMRGTNNAWAC